MSKRKHYDNKFKVQAAKLDLGPGTQTPARALTMNEELIELRKQVKEQLKAKDVKLYASAIFDCFDLAVLGLAMSYRNNRRICTANGELPPMAKRKEYYTSIEAA